MTTKEELKEEYIKNQTKDWDDETKENYLTFVEADFVSYYKGYMDGLSHNGAEVEKMKLLGDDLANKIMEYYDADGSINQVGMLDAVKAWDYFRN